MITLTKQTLSKILNIDIPGEDFTIKGVAVNSKAIQSGNLFVTWEGEHCDGHQFCEEAVKRGAKALLVAKQTDAQAPHLIVEDPIKALGQLAAFWRSYFNLPVIGVTGSNGKTTTKNMLRTILSTAYGKQSCLAPLKSFNNQTGVPLTLAMLGEAHQAAVIEMGMNHFGEIEYLTNLAKPTIALITNAGPGHLAGVGTVAGVAEAKGEIFTGLGETTGTAILNADDAFYPYWQELVGQKEVISFGLSVEASITARNITLNQGCAFTLLTPIGETEVKLSLLGQHNVMNALAASAVATALNLDLSIIKQGLESVQPEPRRLELKQIVNGAKLIDDSYNANPASMRAAIDVLMQFSGAKIAVLGDMRELGEEELMLHRQLGEYAKQQGVDYLFATGELMQETVQAFGEGATHCVTNSKLVEAAKPFLDEEAVCLVKASLSMNFIEVVNQLTG